MNSPSEIIQQRHGYLQMPELQALKQVILSLPQGSKCVNIGAGFGTSGLAFMESPNVSKYYSIEKFARIAENGLGSLEFELNTLAEFRLVNARYVPILMDSIEAGNTWEFGLVDMVFIDGDHSYEHCKGDIQSWLPYIKKGGIMAFHDYGETDGLGGVSAAVNELLMAKYKLISAAKAFAAFRIT